MHPRRWISLTTLLATSVVGVGVAGCDNGAIRRRQLASGNPLDRAQAAVRAAELGDPAAIHALVDLLDDRDDAVRMVAILSLRRLCGQDLGYRYYEDEAARAAAVERWRAAVRAGTIRVAVGRPPAVAEGVETAPYSPTAAEDAAP